MSEWKGNSLYGQGPIKVSEGYSFDSTTGRTYDVEYQGSKNAMDGLLYQLSRNNDIVRLNLSQVDADLWRLNMSIPRWYFANQEPPVETWQQTTELIEKEIWSHPTVQADQKTSGLEWGPYKHMIEQELEQGLDGSQLVTPVQLSVFKEIARGGANYEAEYQVLRRTRSGSRVYPWDRIIYQTQYIYTLAEIGAPTSGVNSLKWAYEAPTVRPQNTFWGWRLRAQQFSIVEDRYEETVEFALAHWSTFLYTVADRSFTS